MTDTQTTEGAADEQATPPPNAGRRRWPLVLAIVAAIVLIGGVAGAVVIARRDDTPTYAAPQVGWMSDSCQQWAASYPADASNRPTGAWCTSMAGWMNTRTAQGQAGPMMGQGQMMGPMMWQSPDNMRATCQQWMASNPSAVPSGTDATAWCGQMVTWMTQHMGDWNGWMTNGPMIGRATTTR